VKEILEQIHRLSEAGLRRYEGSEDGELWALATEAKRMERFIRETAAGINGLNEKLNLAEGRLQMWERRLIATATKVAQDAVTKTGQRSRKQPQASKRKARKSV
jgi:hypothetical protein